MKQAKPVAVSAYPMTGSSVQPLPASLNPAHIMSQESVTLYNPLRPGGRFKKVSPDSIRFFDLKDNFIVDHEFNQSLDLKNMSTQLDTHNRQLLATNLIDFAAYSMLQEQLKQPRNFRRKMMIDLDQIKSVLEDPGRELKPGSIKPSSPKLTK